MPCESILLLRVFLREQLADELRKPERRSELTIQEEQLALIMLHK